MKPVELLSDATVALKCPSCGAVYKPRPLAMQELWNHTAEVLAEMDRRFAGMRFRYAETGTGTDHLVEVSATGDALAILSVRDYALVKALFRFLAIDEGWPEVADPDWSKFQFVAEPSGHDNRRM